MTQSTHTVFGTSSSRTIPLIISACLLIVAGTLAFSGFTKKDSVQKPKAIFLENITWPEAEKVLTSETVVVIPLGGASKEHGPHLPLNTDWLQAEYYKNEVAKKAKVVIMPTVAY